MPDPAPFCATSSNPDDIFRVSTFWTAPAGDCVMYHVTWSGDILWETPVEEPQGEDDVRGDSYQIAADAPPYTKYSVELLYDSDKTASCEVTTGQTGEGKYGQNCLL